MKKTIAIDINEVIRAHWLAVEQYYPKYHSRFFKNEGEIIRPFNTYEYLNHFKFEDKFVDSKVLKEDLKEIPVEWYHTKNNNGEIKADVHLFDSKKEFLTASDQLNNFLYEEYLFEVFGSCGKVYSSVINDLSSFYEKNKKKYNIKIVSLEEYKTIPATLFFLSKCGIVISDYSFYGDPKRLWKECDICITANPKILITKPFYKKSIKVEREFNSNLKATRTIINLSDLIDQDFNKYIKTFLF